MPIDRDAVLLRHSKRAAAAIVLVRVSCIPGRAFYLALRTPDTRHPIGADRTARASRPVMSHGDHARVDLRAACFSRRIPRRIPARARDLAIHVIRAISPVRQGPPRARARDRVGFSAAADSDDGCVSATRGADRGTGSRVPTVVDLGDARGRRSVGYTCRCRR